MKIRIEVDAKTEEVEIVVRCPEITDEVIQLQSMLNDSSYDVAKVVFYKNEQEYYISLDDILFFETGADGVSAHTSNNDYHVKHKLYELERILPRGFVRVSKSTIVNSYNIHSILKNITSASRIEFMNTSKKTYVSRNYYNQLKARLMEKRR